MSFIFLTAQRFTLLRQIHTVFQSVHNHINFTDWIQCTTLTHLFLRTQVTKWECGRKGLNLITLRTDSRATAWERGILGSNRVHPAGWGLAAAGEGQKAFDQSAVSSEGGHYNSCSFVWWRSEEDRMKEKERAEEGKRRRKRRWRGRGRRERGGRSRSLSISAGSAPLVHTHTPGTLCSLYKSLDL